MRLVVYLMCRPQLAANLTFCSLSGYYQAIAAINASKIKKRVVAVDWTVPRDVYEKANGAAGVYMPAYLLHHATVALSVT